MDEAVLLMMDDCDGLRWEDDDARGRSKIASSGGVWLLDMFPDLEDTADDDADEEWGWFDDI